MTNTYQVSGMTCTGCLAKVQKLLSGVEGVNNVTMSLELGEAQIEMKHHVSTTVLQDSLKEYTQYQLSERAAMPSVEELHTNSPSWLSTYKEVLLIFLYISAISSYVAWSNNGISAMRFMQVFMSGFFLVFSFFKLLDLKGFAESYAMYDVLAKKIPLWGYVYPFIELALGLAFLVNLYPLITNVVTLAVMGLSIVGVLQSLLNKRQIKCACLGAVFNLPMSTITIIEDGLMIVMSGLMVFYLL
jgi:copper chaperone CopZ